MAYFVKSHYDDSKILFESKTASNIKEAVQEAAKAGVNLFRVNLFRANLSALTFPTLTFPTLKMQIY
jgi:hypothetical protein